MGGAPSIHWLVGTAMKRCQGNGLWPVLSKSSITPFMSSSNVPDLDSRTLLTVVFKTPSFVLKETGLRSHSFQARTLPSSCVELWKDLGWWHKSWHWPHDLSLFLDQYWRKRHNDTLPNMLALEDVHFMASTWWIYWTPDVYLDTSWGILHTTAPGEDLARNLIAFNSHLSSLWWLSSWETALVCGCFLCRNGPPLHHDLW